MKVFLFAGIIGIFVLLPVNCSGDKLDNIDFDNLSNNSLDVFTISNVNNGSKGYVFNPSLDINVKTNASEVM